MAVFLKGTISKQKAKRYLKDLLVRCDKKQNYCESCRALVGRLLASISSLPSR